MRAFFAALLVCLTVLATGNVAPADVGAKTGHPRIWLTPERLTRLQDRRSRNTTRRQKVVTRANAGDVVAQALMYQVAGDTAKADSAISWVPPRTATSRCTIP